MDEDEINEHVGEALENGVVSAALTSALAQGKLFGLTDDELRELFEANLRAVNSIDELVRKGLGAEDANAHPRRAAMTIVKDPPPDPA